MSEEKKLEKNEEKEEKTIKSPRKKQPESYILSLTETQNR